MDHTMGFCPNKKQAFPYFTDSLTLFRTSQNPTTLFTKQIDLIERPCEPEFPKVHINHRNSKFRSMLTTHPNYKGLGTFQPPIPQCNIYYRYVSGILGSKSLCPTGFGHLTWDMLISDCLDEIRLYRKSNCDTSVCQKEQSFCSSPLQQNTHLSTITSPPKKKFAKEDLIVERRGNSPILSEGSATPGNCTQKQSYAEVAKATVPSTNHSQTGSESYLKGTIPQSLQPRGSRSGQHSGKTTHQSIRLPSGRRGSKSSYSIGNCANSAVLSDDFGAEVKTDRRSPSQTQTTQRNSGRNSFPRRWRKNIERNRNPCGSKTGRVAVKHSSSESYPKTHPTCDERGSSPFRSKKKYCDIEMVNWRTGEPIFKMGVDVESGNVARVPKKMAEPAGLEGRHCEEAFGIVGCDSDRERKCSESGSSTISSGSELQLPSATTRRRSYSSECSVDSEDSFIVFQTAYSDSLSDLTGDWSDCSSEESYDSDSDRGFEFDSCDGNGCSPSSSEVLREINSRWHREHEHSSSQPKAREQENSPSKQKKVQFSPSKPKVHSMVAWEYAYRQARIGPWEQMYRDRSRFQERIKRTESVIAPILSSQHRARIWNTLYS